MNKNTCIVEVRGRRLHFWPYAYWTNRGAGVVEVDAWPSVLSRRLKKSGLYSIQRVSKGTRGAVSVGIRGLYCEDCEVVLPVEWLHLRTGETYYVCQQFLDFIGVKTPGEDQKRYFRLKVTKI